MDFEACQRHEELRKEWELRSEVVILKKAPQSSFSRVCSARPGETPFGVVLVDHGLRRLLFAARLVVHVEERVTENADQLAETVSVVCASASDFVSAFVAHDGLEELFVGVGALEAPLPLEEPDEVKRAPSSLCYLLGGFGERHGELRARDLEEPVDGHEAELFPDDHLLREWLKVCEDEPMMLFGEALEPILAVVASWDGPTVEDEDLRVRTDAEDHLIRGEVDDDQGSLIDLGESSPHVSEQSLLTDHVGRLDHSVLLLQQLVCRPALCLESEADS